MRLEHPIFQGPLRPEIVLEPRATPDNYRAYPDGADLPEEIEVWRVLDGEFPESLDVGLVSDPYGFEDSSDTEWISTGINSKGPRSVALGRDGNLFLWGFAGDPTQMTESARRVFLNTLCYMKRFDGRVPLVRRQRQAREWAFFYPSYLKAHPDEASIEALVKRVTPGDVLASVGLDPDALTAYYRANLEYLVPGAAGGFEVDADCASLGVSNRDPALLDLVVERLRADPDDGVARRLAERYLEPELRAADALEAWLAENRERVFFSDVGGFRWFVDVHAPTAAGAGGPPAVESWGTMREALRLGRSEARVSLDGLAADGAIGVGALAGLAGEVTIVDGRVLISTAGAGDRSCVLREAPGGAAATLLVRAEVDHWQERSLPDCASYDALEAAIAAALRANGFDAATPTPVRVRGRASRVAFHVIDGACPIADPDGPAPWRFDGAIDDVELVGFYVEGAAGRYTHHTRSSHLHVVAADMMGHLDDVWLTDVSLRLPVARRSN